MIPENPSPYPAQPASKPMQSSGFERLNGTGYHLEEPPELRLYGNGQN